jgi:hypothetical protein
VRVQKVFPQPGPPVSVEIDIDRDPKLNLSLQSAICIGIEVVKRAGRNDDWRRINAAVFLIDYWEVL